LFKSIISSLLSGANEFFYFFDGGSGVEGQIDFSKFSLSVYHPFTDMVDLSKATPEQKKRFFKIIESYCERSLIEDYSIFTDQELKRSCLSAQIETIQNTIHLVPDKTIVYNHLANAYDAKGELQLVIECYQKALAINPNLAGTHNNLGLVYSRKNILDKAISEFKKALTINPDLALTHNNLGIAYYKKGMLDESISEYKQAIIIKPDYANAHNDLAVSYYYKGNYKLAMIHCDKAVELGYNVHPKLLELLKPYR
jgi:tetratricopeptide (TPR) repeat protein